MFGTSYDKINQYEKYFGEVVEICKDDRIGKIKVRVHTKFDDIPVEYIPWAYPKDFDESELDMPHVGELVFVQFHNSDVQFPQWFKRRKDQDISEISDDDWESSVILKERDLSKYGLDGKLSVRYTKSEGLLLQLLRGEKSSEIILRNDNSIFLKNGNSEHVVHITDNISIGSENQSQQPAVVGDDNLEALKKLNQEIMDMAEHMKTQLNNLSELSGASPYTRHLQVGFKIYGETLEAKIKSIYEANDNFFPETQSKIVTIDKN